MTVVRLADGMTEEDWMLALTAFGVTPRRADGRDSWHRTA